jgi:hypothetical protein
MSILYAMRKRYRPQSLRNNRPLGAFFIEELREGREMTNIAEGYLQPAR